MIPRKELLNLLEARLEGTVSQEQLKRIAEEILELESGWEEMDLSHKDLGYSVAVGCSDICWLADQVDHGAVLKVYRKKRQPA